MKHLRLLMIVGVFVCALGLTVLGVKAADMSRKAASFDPGARGSSLDLYPSGYLNSQINPEGAVPGGLVNSSSGYQEKKSYASPLPPASSTGFDPRQLDAEADKPFKGEIPDSNLPANLPEQVKEAILSGKSAIDTSRSAFTMPWQGYTGAGYEDYLTSRWSPEASLPVDLDEFGTRTGLVRGNAPASVRMPFAPIPSDASFEVCMDESRIWGVVGAEETVTITVDGVQMGAALADHIGFFWSMLYAPDGTRPVLDGGEQVRIYQNGTQVADLTLRTITGQMNLVDNTVSGHISGVSSPISVTVYAPGEPLMTASWVSVNTETNGDFTVDFTGVYTLIGWDAPTIAYKDNDVEVHQPVEPTSSLIVRPWPFNWVFGSAPLGTTVNVTVYEADHTTVKDTQVVQVDRYGFYFATANADIVQDDFVDVEFAGGGVRSVEISVIPSLLVDPLNDRITGAVEAGDTVYALVDDLRAFGWQMVTSSTVASGTGGYTFDFTGDVDLLPGRNVWVYVRDDEGDAVDMRGWTPSVAVNQTWDEVSGSGAPIPGPATEGAPVSLELYRVSSGETLTISKGMSWNASYVFNPDDGLPDIAPGDIITVTSPNFGWQGVVHVGGITAQADLELDRFTGTVEEPSARVELWGSWFLGNFYPVNGSFDTVGYAASPYDIDVPGFDVDYNLQYDVRHRTAGEYLDSISLETGGMGVVVPGNAVLVNLTEPGVPFTITVYDSSDQIKLVRTGVSQAPNGYSGWQSFWGTGQQIVPGDRVQVQSALGFDKSVVVPLITMTPDVAQDVVYGHGPANVLLYVNPYEHGEGFVPTNGNGEFVFNVSDLQSVWGNGDLVWGNNIGVEFFDDNNTWVWEEYGWPQIVARVEMAGRSSIYGNAIVGNPVVITVTDGTGQVVATGSTVHGDCWNCYWLDLPDNSLLPGYTVTGDFGGGFIDSVEVVSITGQADVATDLVHGTAPADVELRINANHAWGDGVDVFAQVDATGYYTGDFGAAGWDILYGDEFGVNYRNQRGNGSEYIFWLPAPELGVYKWNWNGYARPGGAFVYGFWYENKGRATAEDTIIVDTLPEYTSWAGDTSGFAHVAAGNVITWYAGDIQPGEGRLFWFAVNVDELSPTGTQVITSNCASIFTATPGDYDASNDTGCSAPVDVWSDEVEVAVDKWPNPGDPTPGQEFDYEVQVCNNRGANVGPVILTETFPAYTTFLYWQPRQDWQNLWNEVSRDGSHLVLEAPGIPGNYCVDLYFRFLLDPDAPLSINLTNVVDVFAAGDVDTGNNRRVNTDAYIVPPRYDLNLNKWFNSAMLVPGGWINYGINYWNTGNAATPAVITDTLPPGTSYQVGSGRKDDGTPFEPVLITNEYIVWDLGELPVNRGFGFSFTLGIEEGVTPNTELVNCATIGDIGISRSPWDETACVSEVVRDHGPNLRVVKWHSWNGDGQLGYKIQFANLGDQPVNGVWITDVLPISTSWDGWWDVGFDKNRIVEMDLTDHLLRWRFSVLYPGDSGGLSFNANLDQPGARARWYTNTVSIDVPVLDPYPGDNFYTDVAFSRGELERIEFWSIGDDQVWMWGSAVPDSLISIQSPGGLFTTTSDGGGYWDKQVGQVYPGDVVNVTAGAGLLPVEITVPDPFSVNIDTTTNQIWGQLGGEGDRIMEVHGQWPDGYREYQMDASGNYLVVYPDIPRGVDGYIRYVKPINYADVIFHRYFRATDLVLRVNYHDEWVEGNYEVGHTVWLTLTESDGVTVKATAELHTDQVPGWGGQTGFATHWQGWDGTQPDIQVGDWVYGRVDNGQTSMARVGEITGVLDSNANTVAGNLSVPWYSGLLRMRCEVWVENGPPGVEVQADANGGAYLCDFDSVGWDLTPGDYVGVRYIEPDNDEIINNFQEPVPHLRVNKWADGNPGEGGNFTFHVQYWNDGNAPAENSVVTDTFVSGMTYLTDTVGLPHTSGGGMADWVAWNLGTLEPYSYGQFDVFVQVTAYASETITNVVHIATSNPFDQGNEDEKWSWWIGHVEPNDTQMTLDKYAWTGDPAPGTDFIWVVNACNKGSTGSTVVAVTDTLPLYTTLNGWWGQHPGWVETYRDGQKLVLERSSVSGWQCSEIYMDFHMDESAPLGNVISNTAVLSASNDLNPDDNWTQNWVKINNPHTNLNINTWWNWGQLVPGGEIRYNIGYGNNGNVAVDHPILITVTLPAHTTFREAWVWGGPRFDPLFVGQGYVVWEIPGLRNGFNNGFEIVLDVDPGAPVGTLLTTSAVIQHQPVEDTFDDNTSSWTEQLFAHGPNLRVRKEGDWQGYGEGHDAWYQVTVENIGDELVDYATVTDTYPVSMSISGGPWLDWGQVVDFTDHPDEHWFSVTYRDVKQGWRTDIKFNAHIDVPGTVPFGLLFTNTADFTLLPGDTNPADNHVEKVLGTGPDLYVTKSLVSGDVLPGEIVTFSLRFGNAQPGHTWWWQTQGNVWLTDTLPAGMEFITSTQRYCGWTEWCSRPPDQVNGQQLFWDMGQMWPGNWNEIRVVARISESVPHGQVLSNFVRINSSQPDIDLEPFYTNNEAVLEITIPVYPPVADFTATPTEGPVPLQVAFTNNSTGDFDTSLWDFGDGNTSSQTNPVHVYNSAGTYTVTLTVSGLGGMDTEIKTAFITVYTPVSANFTATPVSGVRPLVVTFTNLSTGDFTSSLWDFGDGTSSTSTNPVHVYTQPGRYTVKLTVSGPGGTETVTFTNYILVYWQVFLPISTRGY